MDYRRKLAVPAYVSVAILFVMPCLEFIQAVSPFSPSGTQWRVLAVGLLSRVLIAPLLALFLAHAVAVFLEQRGVLRVLALLNSTLALLTLVLLGLFALDALEVRAQVAPQSRHAYELGVLFSAAKFGLAFIFVSTCAILQWQAVRELKPRTDGASLAAPWLRAHAEGAEAASYAAATSEAEIHQLQ